MRGRWIKWREYCREYVLDFSKPLWTKEEKAEWIKNHPLPAGALVIHTNRDSYGWRSLPQRAYLGDKEPT